MNYGKIKIESEEENKMNKKKWENERKENERK